MAKSKMTKNRLTLFVDGERVDLDGDAAITVSAKTVSYLTMEAGTKRRTKNMDVPVTPRNRKIFGAPEQATSLAKFNSAEHTARVEAEGAVVVEGRAFMIACGVEGYGGRACYTIGISDCADDWMQSAAATPLRSLDVPFSTTLRGSVIAESWSWDKPVRFLPVQRDGFEVQNPSANVFPPVKMLTYEDYHPFLHIRTMIERIFGSAGYSISSSFLSSGVFDRLYMSGNYEARSSAADREAMDFKAGRFAAASSSADVWGRVYADPYRSFNSLGNIVETANPDEQKNGMRADGVYDKGGCFRMDGDRVAFVPTREVTVAFRYNLLYTTDYYIASRDELKGFNRIYLGDGTEREFSMPNRFVDRKNAPTTNFTYRIVVFGYVAGSSYQIRYEELTNVLNQTYVSRTTSPFSARSTTFVTGSSRIRNIAIWVKPAGSGFYSRYTDDWAMYDGYVGERGRMDVEVEVTGNAEKISPSKPKFFDLIIFEGALEGMSLILDKKTTVTPVFAEYPSEGTQVEFSQLAVHDASCLDLLKAVSQMYNLHFYTDGSSKTVYIEPRTGFYNREVVDWSGKVDVSKPVVVTEPGRELGQQTCLAYRTGDGAVTRRNQAQRDILGQWIAPVGNKLADPVKTFRNPLFTASINRKGDFRNAPTAQLIQAGDRDSTESWKAGNLNFPPKVVFYAGMAALPVGEKWGWPSSGSTYPLLLFFEPELYVQIGSDQVALYQKGLSLCFEDREGMKGLNRYWAPMIDSCNDGKRIEACIALAPHEAGQLMRPNVTGRDMRALYRLSIGGDTALYRLEEVCDYDPSSPESTKCVFIREV